MTSSIRNPSIAVIIPCYGASAHILSVLNAIPPIVNNIYVIDDCCPDKTGAIVETNCTDKRVKVVFHDRNRGVGGATITGFKAALNAGADILVKVDGDGQMRLEYLEDLINPITKGLADFAKGNRFFDLEALRTMPVSRRVGNFGLSLLTKFASGNWHISDPTNGYFAVHESSLRRLSLSRLDNRYFFETSLLIQLNIIRSSLIDIPIPALYGNEKSNLKISRTLVEFPIKLGKGLFHRIIWRYFIYDVNAVSLFLILGFALGSGGTAFGIIRYIYGINTNTFQSAGTVALSFLPIILGVMMILEAILLDIIDTPRVAIQQTHRRH